MMQIKINRLSLENFKCHKHLDINLAGGNADIRGDNATGKSSIYDALTWLLFDKDSHGSAKFEIKPLNADGDVADHEAITAVDCELTAGAEAITLRKTLRENWSARRGSRELVYTGNTVEYFVDGVPRRKSEFDQKVKSLCDEDTFRVLTSVAWFPDGMTWQKRRAVLMGAFGDISDADIMERNDALHPLLTALNGTPLEDGKRLWSARIKSLKSAKTDTPARLDELARQTRELEALDYGAMEKELAEATEKIAAVDARLLEAENGEEVRKLEMELADLRLTQKAIVQENDLYRRSQEVNRPNLAPLTNAVAACEAAVRRWNGDVAYYGKSIVKLRNDLAGLRTKWQEENAAEFRDVICPTCGQHLPAEKIADARSRFDRKKNENLQKIEAEAAVCKARIMEEEANHEDAEKKLAEADAELKTALADVEKAKSATAPAVVDMDGYSERLEAVLTASKQIEDRIFSIRSDSARYRLDNMAERNTLVGIAEALRRSLAKRDLIAENNARMDQLREEAKKIAAELEELESLMDLAEDFIRIKCKMLEDRINGHFRLAKFRLFRTQANGGIEDRCDVTYGGVPYGSLNFGMRINVGVDIINTLSGIYGITVPLFIDNAESVTALEPCLAQTIRLVVDEKCKEVIINGKD